MSAADAVAWCPPGWTWRTPRPDDVDALIRLRAGQQERMTGSGRLDPELVRSEAVGTGSWTRRQRVVADPDDVVRAWIQVHDRAAGRVGVDLTADPALGALLSAGDTDRLAAALLAWAAAAAEPVIRLRGLESTQLSAIAYADDDRQRRWLAAAGYACVRTWLEMVRPVTAAEAAPDAFPPPRPGVHVRAVRTHPDGLPLADDLQLVHQVLEESFVDHFNSYRESFSEFVQRLREDPGHRWDHWWLAMITDADAEDQGDDRTERIGGAVVSTVLAPDAAGVEGSYIDYIGVHRSARGRGVAKALLHTVITDTAARGRNRVALEVDADSPTGADGLYRSLGWETAYRTESWHRTLAL
ncbi:ribosomal protein S18 acetylase RimI-like enzyme [Friedmanniella endophytica]|uniref:Ribosomal protein S18 acetylase RimI-like enzyme n=1 Tax=Microlunatus kandeliicorticis TaxID=1759536 RepID=A0A7W3IT78_9ACTN|nr:GNAT family N-acetyltransferase [Microlunatus kandeliicorticis]MBA8794796.1 ribosomal protein S18 acetylase RimI-like enzyme [Microlunatus kandeliicorticis]